MVLWDVESKTSKLLLREQEKEWINITDSLRFLPGDQFLWASERSGFRHLYLYRRTGELVRQLTRGEWEVTSVSSADPALGWIYFTATEHDAIQRHAYRIRLDGSGMQRLTETDGTHSISLDPASSYFIDVVSALLVSPQYFLVKTADLSSARFLASQPLEQFDLIRPEITLLHSPDGAPIRVMLLKPAGMETGKRYPVLVYVYGGPHAPVISNAFLGERFFWHQWMAHRGYVVAYIDDRTSAVPGHKYEIALYKKFGFVELEDHRTAVTFLRSLPFVDGERIGLWGWSGGGYTTCFNLANAGDVFKVGVAVAPLTDFRDYDTIWTERYMGSPRENPEAYQQSSAPTHAAKLSGKLLLVHGTADDNVHLQNTIRMAQSLVEADKMFDLFLYPGKTHGLAGASTHRHLYEKIADYFDRYLKQ